MAKVTLVGAGPGDPGLLTIKGKQAIEQAEVVFLDNLVGEGVVELIPPDAEVIDVGKISGNHRVPQDKINELLLEAAKRDKRVVRLKGGDPYLFGRGGEELELLCDAGIPFEVVPGITSAIAVPAYAGIPVTHRDYSSSVHIITGHKKSGSTGDMDFESLVRHGGTLVFLMGVENLERLCTGLLRAGMRSDMPAALVQNGTRSNQRKLVSTLSQIVADSAEAGIAPPAVLVIGDVCKVSERFDWFSRLPLFGKQVLVTRPRTAPARMTQRLRELGCGVTEYPCIQLEKVTEGTQQVFGKLKEYAWIVFTSAFGADLFFKELWANGGDMRELAHVKFAAIGSATAAELTRRCIHCDCMPEVYNAGELGALLAKTAKPDEKILLYRARAGVPALPQALAAAGLSYDDVPAYNTNFENRMSAEVKTRLLNGEIDYVTFTSASTVTGFVQSVGEMDFTKVTGICIGEQTAERAREFGINVKISEKSTIDSMVDLMLQL